jgi:phosphate transport system substrate-binding protein
MKPTLPLVALLLGVLAPTIASSQTVGPVKLVGKVTASGSTTVSPLMAEIAKRLEEKNPGLRIDIQTGGRRAASTTRSKARPTSA